MRLLSATLFVLAAAWGQAQTHCDSLAVVLGQMINLYDSLAKEQVEFTKLAADQMSQIDALINKVSTSNFALEKARKEAETLRLIMTGYVTTIDSLHKSNTELHRELEELKEERR